MRVTNFKLGICVPLTYHSVPSTFFDSFIAMEKPDFLYFRTSGKPLDDMRNALLDDAMSSGCTHVIFMDTDQCYPANTIPRLLSHNLPIVGGMVNRRYPPFDPLLLIGDTGGYRTAEDWKPGDLVEVDATGTGCLLFRTEVFKKMPSPWFRFRMVGGRQVGEDIGFCADAKAAGFKIFVDTSVEIAHLTQFQVTMGTYELFMSVEKEKKRRAEKAAQQQAA